MSPHRFLICVLLLLIHCPAQAADNKEPVPLPGTAPLTLDGDIADRLVTGVDKFLLRETEKTVERRARHWKRDLSSAEAYEKSVAANRERLAHILGVRDARAPFDAPEQVAGVGETALVGRGAGFEVYAVRWPAFADVTAEGLLLVPTAGKPIADVVAIPDAGQLPEQLAGLMPGVPAESQYVRRLAESGCRVLVPVLIDREKKIRRPDRGPWLTSREYIYRPAYELGRHIIGYETQKVLAGVDWFKKKGNGKVAVVGWGEGGMLALTAGALDPRIDAVMVSGYFDDRRNLWQEPIDRNVFGLLDQFGDAELASLIAPRALVIEAARGPEVTIPSDGGGPGRLLTPKLEDVRAEVARAKALTAALKPPLTLIESGDGTGPFGSPAALEALLAIVAPGTKLAAASKAAENLRPDFKAGPRQDRQLHELDRHGQAVLNDSPAVRKAFLAKLDTKTPEGYAKTVEPYREFFATDVIGRFDEPMLPANARCRKIEDGPTWTRYEVVLDVFPDVIAYGLLTLPKGMKKDERRPVVVCQHGLEGRPQDTVSEKGEKGYTSYKAFATRLAERGFITFAPQNLYLFKDRFRTLQRKANPLGKTLFSIIVPQHQQITDWLKTLPNVDPERIGFYGLSYGGKSAMRIPPLVKNYCLSICSADFNDWVWKNAATDRMSLPYGYIWTNEYEMFEFDLGSTFGYAEMAALIAPRPFMVERGHFDGVGSDERVAYEFAKVRELYEAKLGLKDRTEIEWFVGPHTINGEGTFRFLHRHLNWPLPEAK